MKGLFYDFKGTALLHFNKPRWPFFQSRVHDFTTDFRMMRKYFSEFCTSSSPWRPPPIVGTFQAQHGSLAIYKCLIKFLYCFQYLYFTKLVFQGKIKLYREKYFFITVN